MSLEFKKSGMMEPKPTDFGSLGLKIYIFFAKDFVLANQ